MPRKIQNRVTFKIKTGHLELLTLETTKLFEGTEITIAKDKNAENVPRSEITEVVLVQCNMVINQYQITSRVWCTFVSDKSFSNY